MVRPKKRIGQHFLTDDNIARKIVDAMDYSRADAVLEIGPGTGILTSKLQKKDTLCYYVEIDTESVNYLKNKYPFISPFLIEKDFLKMNLAELGQESFSIIGNLPYNISSQIFFKILDNIDLIPEVVCMIQYEVAERISSPPNSKKYGILSVLLQAYYDVEFLFKVPPQVFNPAPEVYSGVIRLRRKVFYKTGLNCDKNKFKQVVKTAFNQRRKMLSNSLKPLLTDGRIVSDLMSKRPEQLSVQDFVSLTQLIE